jgi:hypothetical protein
MKTIFCDIDGVLLKQPVDFLRIAKANMAAELPGSAAKLLEWHTEGHMVILTTGRPEHMRQITEENLQLWGILYDQLIMGLGSGPRVLINDMDPKEPDVGKATAVNLHRNEGIEHVLL